MKKKKSSFGSAEFTISVHVDKVEMLIHGNHVVARTNKDVYNKIFDYAVKQLGSRIDGLQ